MRLVLSTTRCLNAIPLPAFQKMSIPTIKQIQQMGLHKGEKMEQQNHETIKIKVDLVHQTLIIAYQQQIETVDQNGHKDVKNVEDEEKVKVGQLTLENMDYTIETVMKQCKRIDDKYREEVTKALSKMMECQNKGQPETKQEPKPVKHTDAKSIPQLLQSIKEIKKQLPQLKQQIFQMKFQDQNLGRQINTMVQSAVNKAQNEEYYKLMQKYKVLQEEKEDAVNQNKELTSEIQQLKQQSEKKNMKQQLEIAQLKDNVQANDKTPQLGKNFVQGLQDHLSKFIKATTNDAQNIINKILDFCKQGNLDQIVNNNQFIAMLLQKIADNVNKPVNDSANMLELLAKVSSDQKTGQCLMPYNFGKYLLQMFQNELNKYDKQLQQLLQQKDLVVKSGNKQDQENYEKQHQNFKQSLEQQDKYLHNLLLALLNIQEIQNATNQVENKIPTDQLIAAIGQLLSHKYSGAVLKQDAFNQLNFINSKEMDGINKIQKGDIIKFLIQMNYCEDPQLQDAVLHLLFNLSFDKNACDEMINMQIIEKINKVMKDQCNMLINQYKSEFQSNDDFKDKILKIAQNHKQHKATDDVNKIAQKVTILCKLICQVCQQPTALQQCGKTSLGIFLITYACISPVVTKEVMQALNLIITNSDVADQIVKTGLLELLVKQYELSNNKEFLNLFVVIQAAISPMNKTSKVDKKDPNQKIDPKSDNQDGQNKTKIVKPEINSQKVISDLIPSILTKDEKQALKMIATMPARAIKPEEAKEYYIRAMKAISNDEKDIEKKIAGASVIAMLLSLAIHTQYILNQGDLKQIPQSIMDLLLFALSHTDLSYEKIGLASENFEYDLLIVTLLCVQRACTYQVLRKSFIKMPQLIKILIRLLYNQPRKLFDKQGVQMSIENTKRELVIKSDQIELIPRMQNIIEALSDIILDIIIQNEQDQVATIKMQKYLRYNADFCKENMAALGGK